MVHSRTDLLPSGSPGPRTGIGTYINYLLAATMVASAALATTLARRRAAIAREPREHEGAAPAGSPRAPSTTEKGA